MSTDEHSIEIEEAGSAEQTESIVERAEREAATIRREAEGDAETIRREAERDAEQVRREAVVAAKRLLERLQALEFPLGELVVSIRDEVEHASRGLGEGEHVESDATPLPPGPQSASARSGRSVSFEEHPAPLSASEFDAVMAARPEGRPPVEDGVRSWWGRFRRGRQGVKPPKGVFVTSEGQCAVCHLTFMAGSDEAPESSGWRVTGYVGLCPNCQADGWRLPEGARLPVRATGR